MLKYLIITILMLYSSLSAGYYGEIASLEHDTDFGWNNSLLQVDTDTYAMAYRGTDNDGFITTFTISADGSTITEVASLEHDLFKGDWNSLVQVDADTYALAYTGSATDGCISTFTISADGSTLTEAAYLKHDNGSGHYSSLVQVDTDAGAVYASTYALAYSGTGGDGFITTFTISADGATITEVATLEHDTDYGIYNSLVQGGSGKYALAYAGTGNDGYITTFTISADGATITEVATLEHDTDTGVSNSIVQVDTDTYALAYSGPGNDGFIKTFTISSAGIVNGVDISGSAGFSLLSSPVSGQIYYDLLDELWTRGMTGSDGGGTAAPNVWTLDVSGQSWTALTDISNSGNSLTAGQGFLVYVFTDTDYDGDNDLPVTLSIDGTVNQASVTVPSSGSIGASEWAVAGNPYAFTIDWDDVTKTNVESTVYVYDNAKSGSPGYISWNGSTGDLTNGLLSPFQGFFIQATSSGSGTITIDVADKSTSTGTFYRREKDDPSASMFFEITSESQYDKTFFSFMNSGNAGKDNADGYKLLPLLASDRAVIISYSDGKAFDINNLPYEYQGIISIPLDVMSLSVVNNENYITEDKDMMLSWNLETLAPHIALTLEDVLTGETINLNTQNEYNFTTYAKGSFPAYNQDASSVASYPLVSEPRFMLSLNYNNSLSVKDVNPLPETFTLHPPYPNPFNPTTTIKYDLSESAFVTLKIYNMLGQEIVTLVNETITPGYYSVDWNPGNLSTGLYIIELKVGDKTFNQNLTYIK